MSYEQHPYEGELHPASDPERALTFLHARGIDAPAHARVLDLGCGVATGAIAYALRHPEAEVAAIDRSEAHIATAAARAEALGLRNISLQCADLREAPAGPFDVITAWSVWSWTDPASQDALLRCAAERLAPDGALVLTANLLPGWHPLLGLRAMARYHLRRTPDPARWPTEVRALLDTLAPAAADAANGYGGWLEAMRGLVHELPDAWVIHDLLAPEQHPISVTELARRAAAAGLHWSGEAPPSAPMPRWPSPVLAVLDEVAARPDGALERAQLADLLLDRRQRATLLTLRALAPARAERVVGLWASVDPSRLDQAPADDHPARAIWTTLRAAWPHRAQVSAATAEDTLAAWESGYVDLARERGSWTATPGERPEVCPLARLHAADRSSAPARTHATVRLSEEARRVVAALDGQRDRAQLAEVLEPTLRALDVDLDSAIASLAASALLIA